MIYKVADSIVSPFGTTTEENYHAVRAMRTGITDYKAGVKESPFPFRASLVDPLRIEELAVMITGARTHLMTPMSQMLTAAYASASSNYYYLPLNYKSGLQARKLAVIVATNKGNIGMVKASEDVLDINLYPWYVVNRFAEKFGSQCTPYILVNSGISGLQAQIMAYRLLEVDNLFDYAVVLAESQVSSFLLSEINAFKLLSDQPVRPYDKRANGVNLGEAVACAIYASEAAFAQDKGLYLKPATMGFMGGYLSNDARNVFDKPNPDALARVIEKTMRGVNPRQLAFINAEGDAVPENDNKESLAIEKTGLSKIPVNSYTANFGYMAAASGLVSSLISCRAMEDNLILPTLGCEQLGVSGKMTVAVNQLQSFKNKPYFLKISACFGGTNAAGLFKKI